MMVNVPVHIGTLRKGTGMANIPISVALLRSCGRTVPPGKYRRNENKTRSWLHCRSARSPLFATTSNGWNRPTLRRRTLGLITWTANASSDVSSVAACPHAALTPPLPLHKPNRLASTKMVQLVADAVSMTWNLYFPGANVVLRLFRIFRGISRTAWNYGDNNNAVLSRVLDCTHLYDRRSILCFPQTICARRTERVFALRTSDKVVVVVTFLFIIIASVLL